ncbi:MAG: glycosyltransferase family 4 protein [Bacteroidota bacterium]
MSQKKPQIAIFGVKYFPSKGGTSRVVEAILRELKDAFDVTIYCYAHPEAKTHLPGVKVVEFPEVPIKGIGVFWFYLRCYWHLRKQRHFELVHIHKIDAALFAPSLAKRFPTIVTAHALPYLNDKWSKIGKRYFKIAEKMYMHERVVPTVISQAHKEHFEASYQKEVQFIPNGIDLDTPIDQEAARQILAQHKVEGPYLFFAARRIIPLKGLHTLLEALHALHYQGNVVIAGDMDQMKDYSQKVLDLAKGLKVQFIGFVGDKPTLLGLVQQAEVFVFPSELEGMSIMLLEAANTDCPIVASDIPANTNMFTEEEVSFFPNKSAEGLNQVLQRVLDQPETTKAKAISARQKVERIYSRQAMAQEYAALYKRILQQLPQKV